MISKFFKHLNTVNRHRWEVFKLCCKAGIPYRGLVHDLSKFSYEEFSESVKYYDGKISPLRICRDKTGISRAWLHHKGRNKHHIEYWYDYASKDGALVMPCKYAIEMICDRIAAGKTYNRKSFTYDNPLAYFYKEQSYMRIHPKIKAFMEEVLTKLKEDGEKVINKKTLTEIYDKHVNNSLKK